MSSREDINFLFESSTNDFTSCQKLKIYIGTDKSSASTVCSPANRTSDLNRCLGGIKAISESTSQFWFGTAYNTRCAGATYSDWECSNSRVGIADSIASRLGLSSNLEFFVDVKYHSSAGTYTSCGNKYTVSESRNISLDPASNEEVTPWEVRMMPTISWAPTNDTYTLFVVDVGVSINHGIYINIPGNRFADAEAFKPYHGPQQFYTSFANVYAFLVFKQQTDNLVLPPDWDARLSNPGFMAYTIPAMMAALNLTGPVGMNWMSVIGDPYAIQRFIDRRSFYQCPYLIQNAIKTHNRSFIPSGTQLTVNIDVTFSPPAFTFSSCCSQYSYPAKTFKLTPLENANVKTGEVRASVIPTVELTITGLFFTRFNFTGRTYTLLCVDPDVPSPTAGTQDRPLLHWQVINIVNGDLSTGHVVMPYAGPMPPDNNPHYYYFLLYEQRMEINSSALVDYADPPGGRFLFNISGFVTDNHLTLAGATWMVATHDEYVRYNYVSNQGRNQSNVCAGVQGYTNPCPTSKAATNNTSWSLLFILICSFICHNHRAA
ncbi:hypothetical protein FSP39_003272 [Pinctada imbricata]|uniref:Uncharacterized protein n=1 Tax=Pinctada imbricata TaxID=66713 RepID=A0AA88XMC7_PINIB|nr:hypothetical protein FSP39_003272 [Pinctada imbricata]